MTYQMDPRNISQQNQDKNIPVSSTSERVFAYVFCYIYFSVLAFIALAVAFIVVKFFFPDTDLSSLGKTVGGILGLFILGGVPYVAKSVEMTLAETRGMSPLKRLTRILKTIHS
jgi:hypothetical protein